MKHLILCPELPPAPIPPGGIGTYVKHISRLLAEAGEVVHVVAPMWDGAMRKIEESCHGRLIVHRVPMDEPLRVSDGARGPGSTAAELHGLRHSMYPAQCFAWQAGLFAEALVEREGIDVIEAQEFQAPLYFFQLRRALGFGPRRRPPCIVFLHSPSEFIVRHNEWDAAMPYRLTAKRMEDYSIGAADALFCPSHFLADEAERHYGLARGAVKVVHLPVGDMAAIERKRGTWADGSILYVGRLEPRKGVVEWVEAAVGVADRFPSARFDFVGADLPYANGMSVQQYVRGRIPTRYKGRFRFHGSRSRKELVGFLARARIAVVPSRWENFPNTCVEAMASGLPVLASRNGGMVEMIDDGINGWLAAGSGSDGLGVTLERALTTPPDVTAAMGSAASATIQRLCNNERIVAEHLVARGQVARMKRLRSVSLPANLPWGRQPFRRTPARRRARAGRGVAIVIAGFKDGRALDECLASIRRQTQAPAALVLLSARGRAGAEDASRRARAAGATVHEVTRDTGAAARNAAVQSVLDAGARPLAFVFLDGADRLHARFLETCAQVLRARPEVGVVSVWTRYVGDRERLVANPCPVFPYQLLDDDTVPASALRTAALEEAGGFRAAMINGYERHDLVNAVMAAGWVAVTVPGVLSERKEGGSENLSSARMPWHQRMRREMLARVPAIVERDARELVLLLESRTAGNSYGSHDGRAGRRRRLLSVRAVLRLPVRRKIRLALEAARHPGRALRFVIRQARRLLARV